MNFAKNFEDLDVWKEACRLVTEIYQVTQSDRFNHDKDLSSQLRRAAISIPSNIAEGFEKGSQKDFIRYLLMARGSAGEIRTQLYLCKALDYIDSEQLAQMKNRVVYISSMLTRLIESIRAKLEK